MRGEQEKAETALRGQNGMSSHCRLSPLPPAAPRAAVHCAPTCLPQAPSLLLELLAAPGRLQRA